MIGLIDCNNFFVSCERLFRPELKKKPVLVLSSNDGCVVARSQEVKDLGIQMGVPYFEIKDTCKQQHITVFSSNFALYRDISKRVMHALKAEYTQVEVYSIDEAFFEVSSVATRDDLSSLRMRVMQKTGIPVSIGVASTKTRAKVANSIAKKGNGVCVLTEEMWNSLHPTMGCGSIWGIGRQTTGALSKVGIHTVRDLLAQDPSYIKQMFGVVGERLRLELLGVPAYKIGTSPIAQQSYTSTRSFGKVVTEKAVLMSALAHHVSHIAQKLRADGNVASTLTVVLQASRFGDYSHRDSSFSVHLALPTHDTVVLTKVVSDILNQQYDPEIPYKRGGVVLGGIQPSGTITSDLFSSAEQNKKTALIDTISDRLVEKFGSNIVHLGVLQNQKTWKENTAYISKSYTTKWSDICKVKAI